MEASPYAYIFKDLSLFTSFPESPNISNVKNDFTILGNKKSINGLL